MDHPGSQGFFDRLELWPATTRKAWQCFWESSRGWCKAAPAGLEDVGHVFPVGAISTVYGVVVHSYSSQVPLPIDLQFSRQSRLQECMQCIFVLLVYKCMARICVDMKLVIYASVMFAAYV